MTTEHVEKSGEIPRCWTDPQTADGEEALRFDSLRFRADMRALWAQSANGRNNGWLSRTKVESGEEEERLL